MQRTMLQCCRGVPGVQMEAHYVPSGEVGGDWYGWDYDSKRHRLFFFIGDVTGHGYAAATMTALAFGAVHMGLEALKSQNGPTQAGDALRELSTDVNRVFMRAARQKRFMTMTFFALDLNDGRLNFVNAGHGPFFQLRPVEAPQRSDRDAVVLEASGTSGTNGVNSMKDTHEASETCDTYKVKSHTALGSPLGFDSHPKLKVKSLQLEPNDLLLLYTDGLIENHPSLHPRESFKQLKKQLGKTRDFSTLLAECQKFSKTMHVHTRAKEPSLPETRPKDEVFLGQEDGLHQHSAGSEWDDLTCVAIAWERPSSGEERTEVVI